MSSVATAPTATAAQTSAAGSRMLGYYLGGGGVKVDCLFDTANFVTKDSTGTVLAPLQIGDVNNYFNLTGSIAQWIVDAGGDQLRFDRASDTYRFLIAGASKLIVGASNTTVAGQLLASNGSGSAPGISFVNDPDTGFWAGGDDSVRVTLAGTTTFHLQTTGFVPNTDNAIRIGWAGGRFSVVYAGTGTINTSDAREKTWRGAPSFAELAAARRIAGELGFYQWNDAIAEKGEDGARYHFGVRAQAVWAIMADEGLIDPIVEGEPPTSPYAFLCYDEWPEIEAVAEERDEEGNITVAAVEPRAAGNRFGIRPDQLTLFLIAAQEARLAALEAA